MSVIFPRSEDYKSERELARDISSLLCRNSITFKHEKQCKGCRLPQDKSQALLNKNRPSPRKVAA